MSGADGVKYRLKIVNSGGGESEVTELDATGSFDGQTLKLYYVYDCAEYELIITGKKLVQSRRGAININSEFAAGQDTSVTVSDGQNDFSIPIFTERLEVTFDGSDCTAECEYLGIEHSGSTVLQVWARVCEDSKFC